MAFVPIYILILLLTIVIDYAAGILIEKSTGSARRGYLVMSLVANIGVLAFFKYFNFFAENINLLLHVSNVHANIELLKFILPIGLSFHTFQAMSYTIEVYRGAQKAERHFGIYALYVMFYPQLVAGPIERPQNLLHQFVEEHHFDFERVKSGLKLILWGLFKKVVIADRLSLMVGNVYKHPENFGHNGPVLVLATLFFTFQIYCDFSGYSDIAIGAARVMGFDLMRNFNRPYFAKSISEFWTRWHMSLSTWFKDYLYIPLGGNRVSTMRNYVNLSIVFLVSGFWHGAKWTFVVWGAVHAFYLVFGLLTKKIRTKALETIGIKSSSRLFVFLSMATTFVLAAFAWIFFRAGTMHDAKFIVANLFTGWGHFFSLAGVRSIVSGLGGNDMIYGTFNTILGFVLIVLLEYMQIKGNHDIGKLIERKAAYTRWGFYIVMIAAILVFGVFEEQEFIYFQF